MLISIVYMKNITILSGVKARDGGSVVDLIGTIMYLGKHRHSQSHDPELGIEGQIL